MTVASGREITLFINRKDGSFDESASWTGRTFAWGDFDDNGTPDLFISTPWEHGDDPTPRQGQHRLLKNDGKAFFVDVSDRAGLKFVIPEGYDGKDWASGGICAAWGYFDNDGDVDLYLLNSSGEYNPSDILYANKGNGTFRAVSHECGFAEEYLGAGCGASWCDANQDGYLDLFVAEGQSGIGGPRGPNVLFISSGGPNNWLRVKAVGTKSCRDGTGTRVVVEAGGKRQIRWQGGDGNGLNSGPQYVHFGLGHAEMVDKTALSWPSGQTRIVKNVPVNQTLVVEE